MPNAQLRPDYLAGTARVHGATGTFVWNNGLITACERLAAGDYRFTIEGADEKENTVTVNPVIRGPADISYGYEFESDLAVRVWFVVNGSPADVDFTIEMHRVRPATPGEVDPSITALPPSVPPASLAALTSLQAYAQSIAAALNGFLEQVLVESPLELSAADLNAAPAGAVTVTFGVRLAMPNQGNEHLWAQFEPVLTPAEDCTDAQISAPTVIGDPQYSQGHLTVTMVMDTDEGATKVYQAGDSVSCDIQVSATDTLLGYTVAMVTQEIDIVA